MSKKLQGNGLWESSKMMLHEHKAYLLERQQPPADSSLRSSLPSPDELRLVRNSVLLPIMISIVESNARSIETSTYPLKKLYMNATHVLLNRLNAELTQTKRKLKECRIQVNAEEHIDGALQYRFVCRGYEDRLILIRDIVRAEISTRIGQHINAMFQEQNDKKDAT